MHAHVYAHMYICVYTDLCMCIYTRACMRDVQGKSGARSAVDGSHASCANPLDIMSKEGLALLG